MMNKRKREKSFQCGDVVWASVDIKFWPGLLIHHVDAGVDSPKDGNQWIFWFHDHRISLVRETRICSFKSNFKRYTKNRLKGSLQLAVLEAIRTIDSGLTAEIGGDQLIRWASSVYGKNSDDSSCDLRKLPEFVSDTLKAIRAQNGKHKFRPPTNDQQRDLLNSIIAGDRKLDDVCLGCYNLCADRLEHPYFEGVLCKKCHNRLKNTILVYDESKIGKYCNVCGHGGRTMMHCKKESCHKTFCDVCSIDLLDKSLRCVCDYADDSLVLRLRDKQTLNVYKWFLYDCHDMPTHDAPADGLTVLSLFDGIATGLYVLKSLKIPIRKYYASEINLNAIKLGRRNHGNEIDYLGDVTNIGADKLKEIGPIDLLIGGSPCNELSLANPNRKGLYHGTGRLFFDYCRIYKLLKNDNGDKRFFWLYENVASMNDKHKESIDSYLGTEGVQVNANLFSPQTRKRLYWSNMPTLRQNYVDCGLKLQDYLDPGRKTSLDKLRTITTQANSHKGEPNLHPVQDGSKICSININELERIFGFADDYTHLPDISRTERQRLLGNAWSAQTIKMFLSFLLIYLEK